MLYGIFLHVLLILSVSLIVLLSYKLVTYIRALRYIKQSEKELINKYKLYK